MELIKDCLERAGLTKAFELISHDDFLGAVDNADCYDAMANGSFHRFLQSLLQPGLFPATWQKLANHGWADEEIGRLFEGKILVEEPATLVNAINNGALSLQEYNQYATAPNQEIKIIYYTDSADRFLTWLQSQMVVPYINDAAFA
jgi:hypothetical protein